jgi:regulator of sirC expression with transglutaminase-like and TPR domain
MTELDIFAGAMRIAREEYPDLDIEAYRGKIDEFARGLRAKITAKDRRAVAQLNNLFFERLGFRGNQEDYYDPKNSYLNDVIDRRLGIPISLSTVYCEIGRRLGLDTYGVGFPGHFLVKCILPEEEVLVDCFHARTLSRPECQSLLESMHAGPATLSDEMFEIATAREILSRMLNNLRRIYSGRQDFARAIRWIEMDMELRPDSAQPFRERGMLLIQMEQFGRALADLERYMRLSPEAPDLAQVREQIGLIRKLLSHLN